MLTARCTTGFGSDVRHVATAPTKVRPACKPAQSPGGWQPLWNPQASDIFELSGERRLIKSNAFPGGIDRLSGFLTDALERGQALSRSLLLNFLSNIKLGWIMISFAKSVDIEQ